MLNSLISAEGGNNWVLILVLGAFFVLMMVMTILPQRKRQKQVQEMMSNLAIGSKVMTIGRLVGKIVSIDSDINQVVLNVGSDENPTLITMDKAGIGYVIDKVENSVSGDVSSDENKTDDNSTNI